ncbi:MAG: HAD-IIIA family hydrolase [Bryobacterales bacterium]
MERTLRAVFLDRDGVINRCRLIAGKPYPPQTVEELELLPGVRSACAELRRAGFMLIVVTNQPDVARGKQTLEGVQRLHARIEQVLPLDEIRMCPHDDADRCACHQAQPGMLLEAAAERRHRPHAQLHGRGPLERHRGRAASRLPHGLARKPVRREQTQISRI